MSIKDVLIVADSCTRVLVVDDHPITRQYFDATVSARPGYELAASLPSAEEAVAWCRFHPVDLIILDVLMKTGMDGLTAAGVIRREHPQIRIILTTSTAEADWLAQAEAIGAEGFWFKNYSDMTLPAVMDRVMAGEQMLLDETAHITLGKAKKADLTKQELEILRHVIACETNEQIADSLCIEISTVKTHIHNLLEKTGFTNRLELAVTAAKSGIVVSDSDRVSEDTRPASELV